MFILLLADFKFVKQFILRLTFVLNRRVWSSPVKYSFPCLFRQFDEKLVFSGVYFGWASCQTDTKIQLWWSPRRCVTEICFSDPLITCLMQNNPSFQSDNQSKEDDGIRFYCRWDWDSLIKNGFLFILRSVGAPLRCMAKVFDGMCKENEVNLAWALTNSSEILEATTWGLVEVPKEYLDYERRRASSLSLGKDCNLTAPPSCILFYKQPNQFYLIILISTLYM